MSKAKPFRIISGGRQFLVRYGKLEICLASYDCPPFLVSALLLEEDTFTVLSADPMIRAPKEHPIRLFTNLLYSEPHETGTVVVRMGQPTRVLAVVHDLSQTPSWKEEWISSAYDHTLEACEAHHIRSIGMPLLGTLHGRFNKTKCAKLLAKKLQQYEGIALERIWIVLEAEEDLPKFQKIFENEYPE